MLRVDPQSGEVRRRMARIAKRYGLDLIVLFGSQRKGGTTARSDVDVAVLWTTRPRPIVRKPWRPSLLREGALVNDLSDALTVGDNLDLAVLNDASPLLLWEVARHGLCLYEAAPGRFEEFWLYALHMWRENAHRYDARAAYLHEQAAQWNTLESTDAA